jgi:hypothetical protein
MEHFFARMFKDAHQLEEEGMMPSEPPQPAPPPVTSAADSAPAAAPSTYSDGAIYLLNFIFGGDGKWRLV